MAGAIGDRLDGGWLSQERAFALVEAAGVPIAPVLVAAEEADAVGLWSRLGGPVMVKADVRGVVHKSGAGAVVGPLDTAEAVASAYRRLVGRFGDRLRQVVVQPVVRAAGPELLVGFVNDPAYGCLLTVGIGGTMTDLVDDRAHCLAPATEEELDELIDSPHCSPRLFTGASGAEPRGALREILAVLSWLGTRLPELAELELNPLIGTGPGLVGVDARARVAPSAPVDPWLRTLPV